MATVKEKLQARLQKMGVKDGDHYARSLMQTLYKTTVRDLIAIKPQGPQAIVETSTAATIRDVLQLLAKFEILSAPVRLSERDGIDYAGFVDVMDILVALLKSYNIESESAAKASWLEWVRDADELVMRGHAFYSTPISEIINASGRDKWCPVYESGSLFELIEVFASGDVHRVPIWRDESHIIHTLVTQSDVLGWLVSQFDVVAGDNSKLLGPVAFVTVAELGLGLDTSSVITMPVSFEAIHAFWLMSRHSVSAIACVDQDGRLVANLSASDIRGLGTDRAKFSALIKPTLEFLKSIKKPFKEPATCSKETTFSDVITKMALY